MEQRLIDANALREDWLENGENEYVYDTNSFLASLDASPTIDPETLPVVQKLRELVKDLEKQLSDWKFWWGPVREQEAQMLRENQAAVKVMSKRCEKTIADLRAELARVTAERDAAVEQLSELECCEFCEYTGCIPRGGVGKCEWRWRGPRKEE